MANIVWELLRRGAPTASQPILDEAIVTARVIVDARERAVFLHRIAVTLSRAGRRDDALALFDEAAAVARTIENVRERAEVLGVIAAALLCEDCEETAMALLDEAVAPAKAFDPMDFSSTIGTIKTILTAFGKAVEARRLVEKHAVNVFITEKYDEVIITLMRMGCMNEALAVAKEMWGQPLQRVLLQIAIAFVQSRTIE